MSQPSNLDVRSWRNTSKTFFVAAESPRMRFRFGQSCSRRTAHYVLFCECGIYRNRTRRLSAVVDRVFCFMLSVSSDVRIR